LSLVLNIIARGICDLSPTQLEIVTLAYSVVAICIYTAYWKKPQNIENAVTIYLDTFSRVPERDQRVRAALQPANDIYNFDLLPHCLITLVFCTVLLGGLHCLAWNFDFPTVVELQMWRTACLVTPVVPALIFASQYLITFLDAQRLVR
jgi:hypothetical protein